MKAFTRVSDTMWPGVVTLPSMAVGASDGRYLRASGIPVYALSGLFNERDDNRAHGRDVRRRSRSPQSRPHSTPENKTQQIMLRSVSNTLTRAEERKITLLC
jgi:hypothetical protein